MQVYVLYNKSSSHERVATDLTSRLQGEHLEAELLDADSPRGIQLAENYDVMGRPAVVVLRADGSPLQVWQGEESLPPVGDIAYYARQ